MRISDGSSDVCSSDLGARRGELSSCESLKSRSHRAKSRCPSRSRKVDGCLDFARHEGKESESKNALAKDFLFLGGRGGVDVGDRRVGQLLDLGFRDRTSTSLTSCHSCASRSPPLACTKKDT